MIRCAAIAQTTGQRCRVHWNLDSFGYCIHHRQQGPAAAVRVPGACKGYAKSGFPCSVTFGLDAEGYCKFHNPNASQCLGYSAVTRRRCKIKWDLDSDGYCRMHRPVESQVNRQCIAVLTSKRRCRQTVGIDAEGFCPLHSAVNITLPVCKSKFCTSNAKPGYDYCCATHDPKFEASYFSPSLFGDSRIRNTVENQIVKRFKGRDLYHGDKLNLDVTGAVELDHIFEKQLFGFAFQRIEFRDGREEVDWLAKMLRDEVVNEVTNLCLTRATTNRMKGNAVWRFIDDTMTGHRVNNKSFIDYLLDENRDDTRLTRGVIRKIRYEMGSALCKCQWKLADESETPALDALSGELQKLSLDMNLPMSSGGNHEHLPVFTMDADRLVDSSEAKNIPTSGATVDATKPTENVLPVLSADANVFVPKLSADANSFTPKQSPNPLMLGHPGSIADSIHRPIGEINEVGEDRSMLSASANPFVPGSVDCEIASDTTENNGVVMQSVD